MQKLLALLPSFLNKSFFRKTFDYCCRYCYLNTCDVSFVYHVYCRALAAIFCIVFASTLYQFNDLLLVDSIQNVSYLKQIPLLLNGFKFLPESSLIGLLWLSLGLSFLMLIGFISFYVLLVNLVTISMLLMQSSTLFSFQWDILLIEVTFFSLFFVSPKVLWLSPRKVVRIWTIRCLPLMLLSVRLFFHSGMVKILSKDPLWASFKALDVHLFSQPLPHYLGYLFHQVIQNFNLSVSITLIIFFTQLIVPFGLLIPKIRRLSAMLLIGLQLGIILIGNYGFFNFLVIVLLVIPLLLKRSTVPIKKIPKLEWGMGLFLIILVVNSVAMIPMPKHGLPLFKTVFRRLIVFNSYGLFANMTRDQMRYKVFVSSDHNHWTSVKLRYFDDDGYPTLSLIQPYHPRIRWQLWFVFLRPTMIPNWYARFIHQLAADPMQLRSIVQKGQGLDKNYRFVRVCYQNIQFKDKFHSLDGNNDGMDSNDYWITIKPTFCYGYDRHKRSFFRFSK